MPEDDFWLRWLGRRRWPFVRGWMFEDIEDTFREMQEFMTRELSELSERVPKDLVRERILPGGGKVKEWGLFVYGYSMTLSPDGKPQIREFGNIKPKTRMGKPRLDVNEGREPLADVLTTDGDLQVLIELPGVSKQDIDLTGTEESLTVSVDTTTRKYYKELQLPVKVDPKSAKSKFTNGVLEVIFKKKLEKEAPKGEKIEIE